MNSRTTFIGLGLVVLLAIIFIGKNVSTSGVPAAKEQASVAAVFTTTASGLQERNDVEGTGTVVAPGSTVTVNYVGTLTDANGKKFDSSYDRGTPFSFKVGEGQVIPCWEEGLKGMKVGGKRVLICPPTLAYGSRDLGVIPPNSILYFIVELLKSD